MKYCIFILIFFLLSFNGYAQKIKKNDKHPKLISESFIGQDSVIVEIEYTDMPSCVEQYPNHALIMIRDTLVYVQNTPLNGDGKRYWAKNNNALLNVIDFERKAKENKIVCGGYVGGNGVIVNMKINGIIVPEFGYCRDNWDGINELINSIIKN